MTTRSNLTLVVGAAGLSLLFLWEQVQATRLGYQVSGARAELHRTRDRIAYLRSEFESLSGPESVAEAAARRLGMAAPLPESVVVLGAPRLAPAPVLAKAPPPAKEEPRPLLASALRR